MHYESTPSTTLPTASSARLHRCHPINFVESDAVDQVLGYESNSVTRTVTSVGTSALLGKARSSNVTLSFGEWCCGSKTYGIVAY